jgi:hypothetical protein
MNLWHKLIRTPSNLPKGKAELISQQIDKISQQPENWENRNDPDLVQVFPKKTCMIADQIRTLKAGITSI